jgi:hypothetical protein
LWQGLGNKGGGLRKSASARRGNSPDMRLGGRARQ